MAYQSNTLSMRQQNRGQEARQVNPVRTVNPTKPYSKWNEKHETELRHREVLLMSLAFPIGIMMAFGGKPALIVLCFGGIISYIFDLLGTVEGTLMAALISGLALWATMILAAREMLSESVMNFPLVLVMGTILIAVFVIISSNFKSLLNEFGSAFYFSEVVLFGIIPLMSSVIISWFLCVEIPTLNLSFCFSTCYFLYTMWLGAPRESSHPMSRSSNTPGNAMLYALPKNVLQAVYFIPLVVSPALHIALCHHVLLDSWGRIVGVAISFLYPFLCMLTCAENQMKYWPAERRPKILNDINNRKLGASALFFFFMQNHPILDDLKKLSGEPKAVSSAILCAAALAGSLTLYLHRLVKSHRTNALRNMTLDDVNNGNDVMRSAKLIFVSFLFSSGMFGLLVFYFLGVSWPPLGFFMGFFVATFYGVPENFRWQHLGNTAVTNFVLLILVILMRFLLLDFLYKTVVIYMTFKFDWAPSPMTMTSYCGRICDVFTLAIAAPTFALGLNDQHSDEQAAKQASLLPIGTPGSKVDSPVVEALNTLKGFLFAAHLLLFSVTFTIAELILREQDWSSVDVGVETVYPGFLLIGTACVSNVTMWHLVKINKTSIPIAWINIAIQSCKLLNLTGVSSIEIFVSTATLLAYTLPFILHVSTSVQVAKMASEKDKDLNSTSNWQENADKKKNESENDGDDVTGSTVESHTVTGMDTLPVNDKWHFNAHPLLFSIYLLLSLEATNLIYSRRLCHNVLEFVSLRDPSSEQQIAACVTLWSTFVALMCLAFYRNATLPRTIMLLVAAGSALVTFEAFPLTLRIDYDSPTYLVIALHPELADSHQSAFLLLSCFLLAAVGAKMVPIKHAVPRVLFLFAFSYCAARTLLGYGFPLALNTNSPHHGTFQLPWLFCLASAFTATSAAIQSSLNSKAGSGSVLGMNMFIICACLPFGALLWSSLTGTFFEISQGIFWCAAVTNASLSIAKRLTQLMREIKVRGAGSGYKKSIGEIREDTSSASICLITSSMCVLWTLSSSLLDPSTSSDINVPLSCLTLMCLNRKIRLIEVHPVALAGVAASTWWLVSGIYSIFVKGYASSAGMAHFELNVGIFGDENVSFWNTDGVWYPLMNLALLIIPLPAIALGFMRRKGESEDILFILAIISLLPVICAQCSSVRLLGVMGTVFGAWRCYDVGVKQADSNRLI